jgi:hypothetical protein
VPPAIPLANPSEPFTVLDPKYFVMDIDPSFILFNDYDCCFGLSYAGHHHTISILQSIKLLNYKLIRVPDPFHTRDVVVALITG